MPYKSKHLLISLSQLIGVFLLLSQNDKAIAQELFPVQQAGKWGYQTAQGNVVITPQYEFAKRFKDQYAIVANQNHLGVIDKNNRLIIPFQYDFIDYLDKDRFEFGFRDTYFGEYKVGVINAQKQVLIKPIFRSINWRANHYVVQTTRDSLISSGEFRGSRGVITKYGLYDLAGKIVIPCKYDYLSWLDDSLLVMQLNNQQALFNVTGQALTPFEYKVISEFHEGLARVVKGGLHGFINHAGKLVIPPRFLLSEPFTNGLAMVMIDNKWGAIDHQGGYSIEPKYSFDEVKSMLKEQPKN